MYLQFSLYRTVGCENHHIIVPPDRPPAIDDLYLIALSVWFGTQFRADMFSFAQPDSRYREWVGHCGDNGNCFL